MRKPPAVATALLHRLGPQDDPLAGDLLEDYRSGRSRLWYWRQVLGAIVLTAVRDTAASPMRTLGAVATGWTTVLLLVLLLGDVATQTVSELLFGWTWIGAYLTQTWWPFQGVAVFVSYAGFALSGMKVARLFRRRAGSMLVAYTVSIPIVLSVSAFVIEVVTRRNGYVSAPHAVSYVVSIALPYQWHSGLLLAPAVTLLAGLIVIARAPSRGAEQG